MGQIIGLWIAAGLTLMIFSFLYKDNPFYKFAEHVYVGVSAAYATFYFWDYVAMPKVVHPLMQPFSARHWLIIIPSIFGLMMLTRWFPKISWVSRWPIAISVGVGSGLAIVQGMQGYVIPQIQSTLLPLFGSSVTFNNPLTNLWSNPINNLIIIIGTITTIIYFYFSKEHKGFIGGTAKVGIVFIMVAFGASFGYTVMARISLLIGRISFLIDDWFIGSIMKIFQ
ncbi:MAG: hypothetical protein E3J78_06575 [Candidatus Cloacimonadota bacterium]|nr:MAG: hypothetical protein E3J78_06575 [Candidatus Cloacimonadota bacterium]